MTAMTIARQPALQNMKKPPSLTNSCSLWNIGLLRDGAPYGDLSRTSYIRSSLRLLIQFRNLSQALDHVFRLREAECAAQAESEAPSGWPSGEASGSGPSGPASPLASTPPSGAPSVPPSGVGTHSSA